MPPLEFEYSKPRMENRIETIDVESEANAPLGVDGSRYQCTQLRNLASCRDASLGRNGDNP